MNQRLRQFINLVRDYAFISVSVTVVIVAGLAGYLLRRNVTQLEQEHALVRQDVEAMRKMLAGAPTLRTDRAAVEAAVKELGANLITEDNLADNLGYFYRIEEVSHARISELHQQTGAAAGTSANFKAIPFTVNVTGSFGQVLSFLHQVEHGPRLAKITAFNVSRRAQGGDAVILELSLDLLARP